MKIAIFYGSGRRDGNSTFLARKVLDGAGNPHETKEFHLAYAGINPCIGCFACRKSGTCIHRDGANELLEAIRWADSIVLSVPVYTFQLAGQFKIFMDRLFPLLSGPPGQYKQTINKNAVLVVTQGAPDSNAFKSCIESTIAAFNMYGMHVRATIICDNANPIGNAEKNGAACEQAVAAGNLLFKEFTASVKEN